MADIAPFRGLRYNPAKVPDLSQVVIPPYDVISPEEQAAFHALSPYNLIRLELGKASAGDAPDDNPHTRAAGFLRQWQESGVLIREETPAIYSYEVDYEALGQKRTRKGILCLLRLEDFSAGKVLPHEKTFREIKAERLGLTAACEANLSPV
ncbi:MAG: DUF1015 family protein, partial [Bacteroidetes bacterium]